MGNWSNKIILQIDKKLKGASEKNIRFFRIDEFKRNIERVDSFSTECPYCQKQKINITEVVDQLDIAIDVPGKSRREFDRLIGRLSSHMQKAHNFYAPYYFTYLFAFFGMVAGIVIGYFLLRLFPLYNWEILTAGFAIGLIAGYFAGSVKDKKIRATNKLM